MVRLSNQQEFLLYRTQTLERGVTVTGVKRRRPLEN